MQLKQLESSKNTSSEMYFLLNDGGDERICPRMLNCLTHWALAALFLMLGKVSCLAP